MVYTKQEANAAFVFVSSLVPRHGLFRIVCRYQYNRPTSKYCSIRVPTKITSTSPIMPSVVLSLIPVTILLATLQLAAASCPDVHHDNKVYMITIIIQHDNQSSLQQQI